MKKFYTRTGDDGSTGILGDGRVEKFDLRMEALGTLDELSAALGMARSLQNDNAVNDRIVRIQRKLYDLMAEVAASLENAGKFAKFDADTLIDLEEQIDQVSLDVEVPEGFIIPGESTASAAMAQARTVTRRAERRVAELLAKGIIENVYILRYLNRLSSLLFVMELALIKTQTSKQPLMAKEK
jgi:cob(I)alamin adenosyltransferase